MRFLISVSVPACDSKSFLPGDSGRRGQEVVLAEFRRKSVDCLVQEQENMGAPRRKKVDKHPLAGQKGEGPPVAPEHWKWRAGNRLRDMYFYSPDGQTFRSRILLSKYLAKLKDAPSPDEFRWIITPELLKTNGPQVATPAKLPSPEPLALKSPEEQTPVTPSKTTKRVTPKRSAKKGRKK